ncbi:MAG: heat shock protein HspQ [Pseudomonadota bacterium]
MKSLLGHYPVYQSARFRIGQVIVHKLFGYRGVIIDMDPVFMLSEDWYNQMAASHPPKECPWYHVLVHNASHKTYVSEVNLGIEAAPDQINHPMLGRYFSRYIKGYYIDVANAWM